MPGLFRPVQDRVSRASFLSDGVPHAPSVHGASDHGGAGAVSVSLLQTKHGCHECIIDCRQVV